MSLDPLPAKVLVNFAMLLATVATMMVIDVWGRRVLLLLGGGVISVSVGIAAASAKMIDDLGDDDTCIGSCGDTKHTYGYQLVDAVCIYAIGFGP